MIRIENNAGGGLVRFCGKGYQRIKSTGDEIWLELRISKKTIEMMFELLTN